MREVASEAQLRQRSPKWLHLGQLATIRPGAPDI